MPSNNKLIIASAGSGKTTYLVDGALSRSDKKIAILTYTNNNVNEIKNKFYIKNGVIPRSVDVLPWFTFLLHECARPYQRSVYPKRRIRKLHFPKGRSDIYAPYSAIERYYFRHSDEIYSDKISRFVIDCETNSKGLVTKRLGNIYDEIYIDEFQDLSGYDLDLLEAFLRSGIRMVIVGDPRQCTYTTNNAPKNKQYHGIGFLKLASKWEENKLCHIDNHARSHRCNQRICDFADMLWPSMKKTKSLSAISTDHDGVFVVSTDNLHQYVKLFSPVILRYNRSFQTYGYPALNFGDSKGLQFDRVIIIPHGPIKKYMENCDMKHVSGSLSKFYVAITRAKHSVAFLHDGQCSSHYTEWLPKTF